MASNSKKWCVFTSAGDFSNVTAWGPNRNDRPWDLVVAFYGDDESEFHRLAAVSKLAYRSKGGKFQNLKRLSDERPELLDDYDLMLISDDDIHMSLEQINRLFEISALYDFWVSQPAFSSEGRVSHPITRCCDGSQIRIANFVELTCPLFRRDKLVEFLQVYDGELVGWGIDWWFCHFFDANENRKLAIIDEVVVLNPYDHQRPGGQREIDKLQSSDLRESVWRATSAKQQIVEYEPRTHAYIASLQEPQPLAGAGDPVWSRLLRMLDGELQRERRDHLSARWKIEGLRSQLKSYRRKVINLKQAVLFRLLLQPLFGRFIKSD